MHGLYITMWLCEPPRTHVKLSCRLGSISQTVVRAGSKGLNHQVKISCRPGSLIRSNSGSSRFEGTEPPRTQVMLPYHNISSTLDFTQMHQPPPPVVTGENIVTFPFPYRFADISDADLDQSVTAVKEQMPDVGERMITGALRSNGIHVPRRRVRQSLHRVDPINVALRWRPRIQRRPYSVPGPNSLWHLGKLLNCLNVILLQHNGSHIIIIMSTSVAC